MACYKLGTILELTAVADLHTKFSSVRTLLRAQFLHFHRHFHRKAPLSEVHASLTGLRPLREILDPPLNCTMISVIKLLKIICAVHS